MLRSNHLQPGINLNAISFPTADLTLKVVVWCHNIFVNVYNLFETVIQSCK